MPVRKGGYLSLTEKHLQIMYQIVRAYNTFDFSVLKGNSLFFFFIFFNRFAFLKGFWQLRQQHRSKLWKFGTFWYYKTDLFTCEVWEFLISLGGQIWSLLNFGFSLPNRLFRKNKKRLLSMRHFSTNPRSGFFSHWEQKKYERDNATLRLSMVAKKRIYIFKWNTSVFTEVMNKGVVRRGSWLYSPTLGHCQINIVDVVLR